MKTKSKWVENLHFTAENRSHVVHMDTKPPLGKDAGLSPKELVTAAIAGCTAMDVISLLKKHRQLPEALEVDCQAEVTKEGYPQIFSQVDLVFRCKGNVEKEKLLEAIHLSQSKYCGVSAMIAKAAPIYYQVFLNDIEVGKGQAKF